MSVENGEIKTTLPPQWVEKLLELCEKTGLRPGELARCLIVQGIRNLEEKEGKLL